MLQRSRGIYNPKAKGMLFNDVFIKFSVNGLTVDRLLRFIHRGLVKPQHKVAGGTLADTVYLAEELFECIKEIKKEKQETEGFFMKEVLEILKIGEKKMKRWMESGELLPDKIIEMKDGRKRYLFQRNSIESFMKNNNLFK